MTQQTLIIVAIAAVAVIIVAGLTWMSRSRRRTLSLREHFGPEYDRVVRAVGDPRKAEAELDARERRVAKLHIRPLPAADLDRYHDSWRDVQARFVEDPKQAVAEADALVGDVMNARGYPVADFDQRVADVSVDHPHVVMHYRAAHKVALRSADGQTDTEELRQALIH
jgi:FtsZ-interacting cell division protein ZipA